MAYDEEEIQSELYIHIVWSVREQKAIIAPINAQQLYPFIRDLVLNSNCTLIAGRVFADHLQLLVKFNPDIALQDLITDIKVGSSLWMTTHCSEIKDFAWQKSDFSFSVACEEVGNLINKIENGSSFVHEIPAILALNGLAFEPDKMFI